eukprot:COSAG04_NODE_23912_length_330_cov_0.744589_1_plen_74_part_10
MGSLTVRQVSDGEEVLAEELFAKLQQEFATLRGFPEVVFIALGFGDANAHCESSRLMRTHASLLHLDRARHCSW